MLGDVCDDDGGGGGVSLVRRMIFGVVAVVHYHYYCDRSLQVQHQQHRSGSCQAQGWGIFLAICRQMRPRFR